MILRERERESGDTTVANRDCSFSLFFSDPDTIFEGIDFPPQVKDAFLKNIKLSTRREEKGETARDRETETATEEAVTERFFLLSLFAEMAPQPTKIRADVEVTCFRYEGIDAIKEVTNTTKEKTQEESRR